MIVGGYSRISPSSARGLTLHQPWADAVARGAKRIETRSWTTRWRGTLIIHASASWTDGRETLSASLPRSAAVAVARLADMRPIVSSTEVLIGEQLVVVDPAERAWGHYALGRFAWFLEDVVPVGPIFCRGAQKLWIPAADLCARIVTDLEARRVTGGAPGHELA